MNSSIWKSLGGNIGPHLKTELDRLTESGRFYQYVKEHQQSATFPDPIGHRDVIYNLYGDLDNNALLGTLIVNGSTHYGRIHSPVVWPRMEDRRFGMDQYDATIFNWLTDMLCYVYIEGKTEMWVLEEWDRNWNERHPDKTVTGS